MVGKTLLILSAFCVAARPAAAGAQGLDGSAENSAKRDGVTKPGRDTGGTSYGNRDRGGPYGFYSYPRHRSVDGGRGSGLDRGFSSLGGGDPSNAYDRNYGSAYYGPNYGAPYHGGGYYDGGTYYRERRD